MPKVPPREMEGRAQKTFKDRGKDLGELIERKQVQYGDACVKSAAIMRILYPNGIAPHQMTDALLQVRVADKQCRIAQRGPDRKDLGGESPWMDIAGYGLRGWALDEEGET